MVEPRLTLARSEFILGGQKSGKSRRAEMLARDWLAQSPSHCAVLIATAQPWDGEMRQRIARHQVDRAERVPGMYTVEEPLALAEKITQLSHPDMLLVVDCLTLWLTNWLMPVEVMEVTPGLDLAEKQAPVPTHQAPVAALLDAIATAPGPVIVVGNEIGLGVIPLGSEVRAFVDALGTLNQQVASVCQRVTLMAAGLPLTLKDSA
jgi:adenosylcobinamide kinase/adenosylcobinamide-phosphate guanylyltransferase